MVLRDGAGSRWRRSWPRDAAQPAEAADYQRLLDQIGAFEVRDYGGDCEILLGRYGNFFRATTKSFVYSPSGEAPKVWKVRPDDTDEQWFKPLGGAWFLEHVVE